MSEIKLSLTLISVKFYASHEQIKKVREEMKTTKEERTTLKEENENLLS